MRLDAADFKVRGASARDMADLDRSLAYLSQSPAAASVLQDMAAKGTTIQIVHDGQDKYSPQNNTVYWDPDAAHSVQGAKGKPPGVQSAAMGLLHEAAHATDPNYAENRATPNGQFDNDAEKHAVGVENAVAADLGEPQRADHSGRPFGSQEDPTFHTPGDMQAVLQYVLRMFARC